MNTPKKRLVEKDSKTSFDGSACFHYQLNILKHEIELIGQIIGQFDKITQTIKNWAVLTWAGSIAIALGDKDLRPFIVVTSVLPFLFWIVDARWRYHQLKASFRFKRISEFLNGENFKQSFDKHTLIGFNILDPLGEQHTKSKEYQRQVSYWRAFRFETVRLFYLGQIIISLALGALFILNS